MRSMRPRHHTVRKGTRRKPTVGSPPRARASSPAEHPVEDEHDLLLAYQEQLQQLDWTVGALRERIQALSQDVADLRDSRAHYLDLFENTPTAYVVHSADGVLFASNRAARKLFGLGQADAKASVSQFVCSGDIPVWLEHLRRCVFTRQKAVSELSLRLKNGRSRPVQVITMPTPLPFPAQPARFHSLFFDITQHRAAKAALLKTQEDYYRLIDTIEGIVWEADAGSLAITFVSRYAERLLGYPVAEWTRPRFWESHIYVEDRERVMEALAGAIGRRGDLRLEYRVQTARRRLLWLHDSLVVTEREGRARITGVALDVTERRAAEQELRQAHQTLEQRVVERTVELGRTVAELEAFSYSVSHDLRSPLRSMLGFAELLLEQEHARLSDEGKHGLKRIVESAGRADRLVRELLAYSRVSRASFSLEPLDVESIVREVIAQHPQLQQPRARVQVRKPLLPVLGHELSLSQCLTNLLSNAAKFVPAGTVPVIQIRTERVNDQVRIWVEDNGIGIEPANLTRIFRIFERVHSPKEYEGAGVGLAIVRKGAERMGGSVGAESQPGQGSRFWLQLKAA